MTKLYFALLLLLSGCGSIKLTDDPVLLSDSQAYYESVLTKLGDHYRFGPAAYMITDLTQDLVIYTALSGSYEIRSDSCNFTKQGAYADSKPIKIPVSEIRNQVDETLCVVTIQISPQIEDSKVPIYPSFSIAYLVFTNRTTVGSDAFQFIQGFNYGVLFRIEDSISRYRVIRKCVYDNIPIVVSESLTPVDRIELPAGDIINNLGSCYFGVVYVDLNGVAKRAAYATNVFDERHLPLSAEVTRDRRNIAVIPSAGNTVCIINGNITRDCKRRAIAQNNVIGVFTNKRSYWAVRD